METIVYNVLSTLLITAITGLATYIATNIKKNRKEQKQHNTAMREMVISIGALELYNLYNRCFIQGYRRPVDTLAFKKLITPYYKLGGNDYIHKVEQDFNSLEEKDV